MRHHIYSEDRKTVQIPTSDLLKELGIDHTKYEIRSTTITAGGYDRGQHDQIIELSLVERPNHEARK